MIESVDSCSAAGSSPPCQVFVKHMDEHVERSMIELLVHVAVLSIYVNTQGLFHGREQNPPST